jgi:MFS transporter, PPP family, 3-phenylpropionic acid transporter
VLYVTEGDPPNSGEWKHAGDAIRAAYFWGFAAIGSFGPFATLYYRDLGFSGLQVGILAAIPAIALTFGAPIWGAAADARSAHRQMLRLALALTALFILAVTQVSTFPGFVVLISLFAVTAAPVAPFLDGYAVSIGERTGASYGSLRVWGSVGYIAAVFGVGQLMGERVDRLFFIAHASFLLATLGATIWLPRLGERRSQPFFAGFQDLSRNRPLAALLVVSFLVSTGIAAIYGFLGIRIEELGGSAGLIGVAVAIGAISELPVIAFGGRILDRIGAQRLIAMAIAVYTLRLALYSVITDPYWVLPVQTLHGLSYGAFLIATVTMVHRLAGKELAASSQTLLAATFGGGNITGALIGGVLLGASGTDVLFGAAAALMLATLIAYVWTQRTIGIGDAEPTVR